MPISPARIAAFQILKRVETDADLIDRFIANRGSMAVIADEMRRAGMKWTVRQFATYVVGGFALGLVAAFWLPFVVALPAGIVCAASPFFIVMRRRKQRDRRVEEQLPEAVDMLVNSMRAGFSLQAGMNVIISYLLSQRPGAADLRRHRALEPEHEATPDSRLR